MIDYVTQSKCENVYSSFNLIFGNILFTSLKNHKFHLRGHSKNTSFEKGGTEVDKKVTKKEIGGADAAEKVM